MSNPFSSHALLLTMSFFIVASACAQQKDQTVLSELKPNFYITTPQTGQRTTVGSQTVSRQSNEIASVAQSQQLDRTHPNSSSRYTVTTPQQTASNSASHSSSRRSAHVVSASAAQPFVQQTAYPSYVAHSSEQRQGLFNKLLHKHTPKNTAAIQPVSNNSPTSYKVSKYSGTVQSGMASWYGKDFHGDKTASGERYNMESMTAAHKTLPFGTMVKVRNERNGQECIVRINNRGPFIRGRILDVSKAAANQLGMVRSGVAKISMQVVGRS